MRLVFMGSDAIALPLLGWLAGAGKTHATVVGVFTSPDRPAGRGQLVAANAIKTWAVAAGIPVFQPEKLTETDQAALAALRPDLALVLAYGQILRDAFIAVPKQGTLNLHTSRLPAYRGASPIQTAVACGERLTGVSLMRIVRELDAGPVADFEPVSVGPLDTAGEVEIKLSAACVPLVARALPKLREGTLEFTPQDAAKATFCRKLTKADGMLDFGVSAAALAARINGLFPWPGCSVTIDGTVIKLGLAEVGGARPPGALSLPDGSNSPAVGASAPGGRAPPGLVLGADESGLLIATADGTLRLRRLQRPGGRMLDAGEFLRGFPVAAGTQLASAPMPPLIAAQPFRSKKANLA